MEIIFSDAPNACSLVPFVRLTEANAAFEVRPLNSVSGQHMVADCLKLNPKEKVPLRIVGGKSLRENVASQSVNARPFPQARLLPAEV